MSLFLPLKDKYSIKHLVCAEMYIPITACFSVSPAMEREMAQWSLEAAEDLLTNARQAANKYGNLELFYAPNTFRVRSI